MNNQIDLNCDMGESYGRWRLGNDRALMPYLTSVNVAAGYHAGDPGTIRSTVAGAVEHGLQIGAHVSLPDLLGFGRRQMQVAPDDLRDYVVYQLGAVSAFARAAGGRVSYVKPHGAMYAMVSDQEELALAVGRALAEVDSELMLLLQTDAFAPQLQGLGVRVVTEGFPDLDYDGDGRLVIESTKRAWDPDVVAARAVRMVAERRVTTTAGTDLSLNIDTLCVHGDAPNALDVVRAVRSALDDAGIAVRPFSAAA